jgi:hypothetical protein
LSNYYSLKDLSSRELMKGIASFATNQACNEREKDKIRQVFIVCELFHLSITNGEAGNKFCRVILPALAYGGRQLSKP